MRFLEGSPLFCLANQLTTRVHCSIKAFSTIRCKGIKLMSNLLNYLQIIAAGIGAIFTGTIAIVFGQYAVDRLAERKTRIRLEKDPYTLKEIKTSSADRSSVYIRPDCQDNDPSSGKEAQNRRSVFAELDALLGPPLKARCIFILADSGMGKTALLCKYYGYHWISSKRSSRFNLVIISLNNPDTKSLIEKISYSESSETVLFLDALDEDRSAIKNCKERLVEITGLTEKFLCVVVT